MYSIAIITAQASLSRILAIDEQMRRECSITYLQYQSSEELLELYRTNMDRYDGFLFSGSFPYDAVSSHFLINPAKPHAFFSVTDRDYYRVITKVAIRYPGIDFSKVHLDTPEIDVDFDFIFDFSNMPQLSTPFPDYRELPSMEAVYQVTLDYYKKLWNEGSVKLIITRLSSLFPKLKEEGIPCVYLSTSPASMLDTFHRLLAQLRAGEVVETTTAFCQITPIEKNFTDAQKTSLEKALYQCNKIFGMCFIIRGAETHFELTTTTSVLKNITNRYSICPVTSFLHETLDFPLAVGWGSANNAVAAYQNALRASKESRHSLGHPAFVVTADNTVIGPLSSQRRIAYSDIPNERIQEVSKKVSLSPLNLQRLAGVLNQKKTNVLSAEELAYYLDITPRSASRILSKLVDAGAAMVSYNRQINLRGRPAKIYTIDFAGL